MFYCCMSGKTGKRDIRKEVGGRHILVVNGLKSHAESGDKDVVKMHNDMRLAQK